MANLPNIEHKKPKKNPTLESPSSSLIIPFYKDIEYFASLNNFISFIKSVEKLVRSHDDYKAYKSHLMGDVGLSYCQVLSNIDEKEFSADEDFNKTTKGSLLEMHHGPVFTLFDIVYIVTQWAVYTDKKITTYNIAEIVLKEHYLNNIQVVMLSKTIHEQVHENNIFISMHQAFGDLNTFVNKYKQGFDINMIKKLNNYIDKSIKYGSFDKGVLELNKTVKDWSQYL